MQPKNIHETIFTAAIAAIALGLPPPAAHAAGLTTLYAFQGGTDGSAPLSGLIADASGNLYGTTTAGGANGCSDCGTVFRIATDGTETVLYAFGATAGDGAQPNGVTMDASGNLFGTTLTGGTANVGSIFEVAADGTESVLYSFTGRNDGGSPRGSVALDGKGNLFGTASTGGTAGSVFELAANGSFTTVYAFKGDKDGAVPAAGLVADAKGNFYGTTSKGGGKGCGGAGCGTIFKLTPSGTETVLYSFTGGADQCSPRAPLLMDGSGNLYGTATASTPCLGDLGTAFELAADGTFTVLHTFGGTDGAYPSAGLVADARGNLYGTTQDGGAKCCGTVFKITPHGGFSVLHNFTGSRDGGYSVGALLLQHRNLYGTASSFGRYGYGTVFKLAK